MAEENGSRVAIVDGSNVARSTDQGEARLANIRRVTEKLDEEGYEPIVFVDAALRHQIDQKTEYEQMVENGAIRQTPAGTDADYFILSFARELNASVVSNDRFRDHERSFSDVTDRLIRFMIVSDEVVFERRTKAR